MPCRLHQSCPHPRNRLDPVETEHVLICNIKPCAEPALPSKTSGLATSFNASLKRNVSSPINYIFTIPLLYLLKAAWTAKVSRYSGMLQAAGTRFNLLPVPLSTLGGWHPDAHRALRSVASTIAARGLSTFSCARSILFQRHAALLVTNNALCFMSGLSSNI